MFFRQLLRKLLSPKYAPPSSLWREVQNSQISPASRRFQSTNPNPAEQAKRARFEKVLNRLPKFMHPYTNGLRDAPVTHVVSFLILHEITAIVPLLGLAGLFHYTNWLPPYLTESEYITEGISRFGRYFAKKGWFGFERESDEHTPGSRQDVATEKDGWNVGNRGSRILVEVATAYAITKVLLPGRILLSVWATPWFARAILGRLKRGVTARFVGRGATGGTERRKIP